MAILVNLDVELAKRKMPVSDLAAAVGITVANISALVVLYWFIHGDPERYLWIISGPAPFSSFGGGPFQLYLYAGPVIAGILAIASGTVAQRRGRVPRTSPH